MADLIMQINARTLDKLAENLLMVNDDNDQQFLELWAVNYVSYAIQNFNQWSHALRNPRPSKVEQESHALYLTKIDKILFPVRVRLARLKPVHSEAQIKYAALALSTGIQGICVLLINEQSDKSETREIEDIVTVLVRNFLRGWLIETNE